MNANPLGLRWLWRNPTLYVVLAILAAFFALLGYMVADYGISIAFLTQPVAISLIVASSAYGLLRGWYYHPAMDRKYAAWLARTPWTADYPLPRGPLHVVWFDLLLVAISSAGAFALAATFTAHAALYAAGAWIGFFLALGMQWTVANVKVDQHCHAYAVAAVPVVFRLLHVPQVAYLLCPLLIAAIAWHGVRRSLREFPWMNLSPGIPLQSNPVNQLFQSQQVKSPYGWPFCDLFFSAAEVRTSFATACLGAALAGGWIWLAVDIISKGHAEADNGPAGISLIIVLATLVLTGGRLLAYSPVICAQLCWGRRVARRQLIIWRHDQIFLAPLLMLLTAWKLPTILVASLGLPIASAAGLTAAAIVLIAMGIGPSIQELQLTGVHSRFGKTLLSKDYAKLGGP